jgi:hypothetical protein
VHSLGQRTPGEPQAASTLAVEDSAFVVAVLRKDLKATAECVAPSCRVSSPPERTRFIHGAVTSARLCSRKGKCLPYNVLRFEP